MEIVKRNGPPEDLIYFDDELPLKRSMFKMLLKSLIPL